MASNSKIIFFGFFAAIFLFWLAVDLAKGEITYRNDFDGTEQYPDFSRWTTVSFRPQLFHILENANASNITVEHSGATNSGILSLTLDIDDHPGLLLAENSIPLSGPKQNETTSVDIQFRAKLPYDDGVISTVYLCPSSCSSHSCLTEYPKIVLVEGKKGKKDDENEPGRTLNFYGYYEDDNSSTSSFQGTMQKSANFSHNMYQDFHTFRFSWKSDCLYWFVDDQMVFSTCSALMMPHVDMSLNFQIERAKDWIAQYPYYDPKYAPIYPPSSLDIDYVQIERVANTVPLPENSETFSHRLSIILPAVLVPITLIVTAVLIIIAVCRKRRHRRTKRMKNGQVNQNLQDKLELQPALAVKRESNVYTLFETQDNAIKEYLKLFAVSSSRVQISSVLLGRGEFGTVHQALVDGLHGRIGPVEVAVKTMIINDAHSSGQIQKAFEDEIRIMQKTGQHLQKYPALILELCELGSLSSYLQSRRPPYGNFTDLVKSSEGPDSSNGSCWDTRPDGYSTLITNRISSDKNLSTKDLMSFSYQVCRGLEYLASRSIIHRDIAARNILLTKNKVAKISDFGMAKHREENYVLANTVQASLPIRWMAPEAIRTLSFSQSSDVWSFGILLWEIFSLGQVPYSGVPISGHVQEFVDWLLAGNCLTIPEYAPYSMYAIMKLCWTISADERPHFKAVLKQIEELLSAESAQYYVLLDEPYERFNVSLEHAVVPGEVAERSAAAVELHRC